MADNQEQNNKAMGWFIAILAILAVALGGALIYVQKGFGGESSEVSTRAYQDRQYPRVAMLKDIKERLIPTLVSAYENKGDQATPEQIAATRNKVEGLMQEIGLTDYTVDPEDANDPNKNERFVRINLDVNAEDVTRGQIESILTEVVKKTGTYATISKVKIEASKKLKPETVSASNDDETFLWNFEFTLTWFKENKGYKAKGTSRKGGT